MLEAAAAKSAIAGGAAESEDGPVVPDSMPTAELTGAAGMVATVLCHLVADGCIVSHGTTPSNPRHNHSIRGGVSGLREMCVIMELDWSLRECLWVQARSQRSLRPRKPRGKPRLRRSQNHVGTTTTTMRMVAVRMIAVMPSVGKCIHD